jgi:outer membrane protein
MRTGVAALVAWIGMASWPGSGVAEVVALPELEKLALRNRPALAADFARERAARADVDKAQSGYYPRLQLLAQSSLAPGRQLVAITDPVSGNQVLVQGSRKLDQPGAFDPQLRHDLGLQLDGSLYDFGRTSAALDAGRARQASAEAEEEATRMQIVRSVRGAYLLWLSDSELHVIAAQAAADATSRRARVEALIGEGVRPKADLSTARTDELLAALELERAGGELRAARLGLAQAVGGELSDTAEPDRSLLATDLPVRPADADAGLRALEAQQRAQNASARMQAKTTAPMLSGNLLAGVHAQGLTLFPSYIVGISFALPLWDGGMSSAAAGSARAHADEIGALMQKHEQERQAEIAHARLDAENAVARLQTADALLQACEQRVTEAEQGYELGASSIEQLAQARALLRRARTEVVIARVGRAEAALRVAGR